MAPDGVAFHETAFRQSLRLAAKQAGASSSRQIGDPKIAPDLIVAVSVAFFGSPLVGRLLGFLSGHLRDFELHGALGLALHYYGAGRHLVAAADVSDPEAGELAATQLAVDAQIEESELAHSAFHLEANSRCQDVFGLERRHLRRRSFPCSMARDE
jgi:hypothetical protein